MRSHHLDTLQVVVMSMITLFLVGILSGSSDTEDKKYDDEKKEKYNVFAPNLPLNATFAGESVPLTDFEVRERFDREILVNTYWHSNTFLLLKRANKYFPEIEAILKEYEVPEDLKYIAVIESGLQNATSPAGAKGYWQFMSATAKDYDLEVSNDVDERYHLEKSTRAAALYMRNAYRELGSWTLAAASYNMGLAGVKRRLFEQKAEDYFDLKLNSETSRYVFRILAAKEILSNPEDYGFQFRNQHLYELPETYNYEISESVDSWVDFALSKGITYKTFKTLNPWLTDDDLYNPNGKTYTVQLPKIDEVEKLNIDSLNNIQDQKREGYVFHTIKPGETIHTLARDYGVDVADIKSYNNLEDIYVKVGEEIRVKKTEE